jgi:hypothetical protein
MIQQDPALAPGGLWSLDTEETVSSASSITANLSSAAPHILAFFESSNWSSVGDWRLRINGSSNAGYDVTRKDGSTVTNNSHFALTDGFTGLRLSGHFQIWTFDGNRNGLSCALVDDASESHLPITGTASVGEGDVSSIEIILSSGSADMTLHVYRRESFP